MLAEDLVQWYVIYEDDGKKKKEARQFLDQLDDWNLPKMTLHYGLTYKDKHL
jgi:hypothetical protein